MRAFFIAIAVLLVLGCAPPAAAHPSPFSYIDVRIPGAAVELTVAAHIFDVAHDLGVQDEAVLLDPAAVAARREAIVALLGQRIQVWVDGRQVTGPVWSAPRLLVDRQAIQLQARYALPAAPSRLTLAVSLFPYDPVHQTFVNVYERDGVVLQAILSRDRHQVEFFPGTTAGHAGGDQALRCVRRPSHPDRARSPALPDRPAVARRLAAPAGAGGERVHRGAQHHALARRARRSLRPLPG